MYIADSPFAQRVYPVGRDELGEHYAHVGYDGKWVRTHVIVPTGVAGRGAYAAYAVEMDGDRTVRRVREADMEMAGANAVRGVVSSMTGASQVRRSTTFPIIDSRYLGGCAWSYTVPFGASGLAAVTADGTAGTLTMRLGNYVVDDDELTASDRKALAESVTSYRATAPAHGLSVRWGVSSSAIEPGWVCVEGQVESTGDTVVLVADPAGLLSHFEVERYTGGTRAVIDAYTARAVAISGAEFIASSVR